VDATVPDKWALIARDAFSGVLLWKHKIGPWGSRAFSGTADIGAGVTVGRFTMPSNVGKRLVAIDDTVYVTLGANAPITALDAATGKRRRVYAETARADEILYSDGRLIVSINPPKRAGTFVPVGKEAPPGAPGKRVCAVDANSGRVLWTKGPFEAIRAARGQDPFGRLELAAGDGQVFILTTEAIESLAADTGKTLWRIERPALPDNAVRRLGYAGMFEFRLTVMVYHDGVVLLAQPEPNTHHTYHTMPGTLYAFDAKTGRPLWKHGYGGWGHCTPPDVFVVGDDVWTHVDAKTEYGSVWGSGFKAIDTSQVDYRIQALDLRTGRLRRELSTKDIFHTGHHHRCYRNRITEKYLMASRRGVEFVDLDAGEHQQHHWVRSGCLLGNLPCNGLLYVAPHPCGCYIEAKLTGFNALAAARQRRKDERGGMKDEGRLQRGVAFGRTASREAALADPHDWPTYRHDAGRSGTTAAAVGAALEPWWTSEIGGRPSGLTVAEGKVFVADVDGHTVHALDAGNGAPAWQHTAGARVDSPPTIYRGLAIFGSADGSVSCVQTDDGALVWQFAAAPEQRRVVAFGQLESAWPVSGSVLMHDDVCWFAAGRSSYLDGGIRVFALNPTTGRVVRERTVFSADPKTGKMTPVPDGHAMPGVLRDILSSDGENVFLRQMNVSSDDKANRRHLFTTAGFLDPSWFNRTYWKIAGVQTSGMMVAAGDRAYGVEIYASRSRETVFRPGAHAYRLSCFSLTQFATPPGGNLAARRGQAKPGRKTLWQHRVPIRITAMVRTAEKLFVAGSPDVSIRTTRTGRGRGVKAAYWPGSMPKVARSSVKSSSTPRPCGTAWRRSTSGCWWPPSTAGSFA